MIPLYGFMQGDTLGLLLVAHEHETVGDLIEKLRRASRVRVEKKFPVDLIYKEKVLAPHLTIAEAGFQALDRFDVTDHTVDTSRWT